MIEAIIKMEAALTASQPTASATTNGPIVIPTGFPDIAWMSTDTAAAAMALNQGILIGTTNAQISTRNAPSSYTARAFNLKIHQAVSVGDRIVVKYRPVGDLVRT